MKPVMKTIGKSTVITLAALGLASIVLSVVRLVKGIISEDPDDSVGVEGESH